METAIRAGLTPEQCKCFLAIESHIAAHGNAPSYDDLRKALGLASKSGVCRLVIGLQARGWITFQGRIPHSIAIVPGAAIAPRTYALPPKVESSLRAFCSTRGEDAAAIVADAVALFLDEADRERAVA
ncbi:MAG: hypothetical protein ACRC9K_12320 [Afipia sp.]